MPDPSRTRIVVFPFDLFGAGGTGAGAGLLAEGLRELFADNRREKTATRARCYAGRVHLREFTFTTLAEYQAWRETGRRAARQALRAGEFLIWLSGNHLGTLPVYDELAGDESALVVQLDAHLDVQNFSDSSPEPTHANFLLHCAGPLPPLVNLGQRDLLLTADHVGRSFRRTFSTAELAADPDAVGTYLRGACAGAGRVFVDLDCDVFDPGFFPAVSRPVPFGLSPQQVLRLLDAVWSDKVAGVMLSEFDPGRDNNDSCLAALLWLLEYVLLRRYEP